jgi:hypothetical protein
MLVRLSEDGGGKKVPVAAEAGDERCRVAAFHEAGHIVVACCRGLAISPRGICIDNFGGGRAWFEGATDGEDVASCAVDNVIVALFAGCVAHRKVSENVGDACQGDEDRITELLEKHYPDPSTRAIKHHALRETSGHFVAENWSMISNIAEALWAKPWRAKHPNRDWPQEKKLSAEELGPLVVPMVPVVDDRVHQPM